jgi:hypothetical protein
MGFNRRLDALTQQTAPSTESRSQKWKVLSTNNTF